MDEESGQDLKNCGQGLWLQSVTFFFGLDQIHERASDGFDMVWSRSFFQDGKHRRWNPETEIFHLQLF